MASAPQWPTGQPARLEALLARETVRPISVADYHHMLDAGILDEGERVELLEGVIIKMSPQKRRHARVIQWLNRQLVTTLGDGYAVLPQLPLALGEWSEPEPDLAVTRAEDAASADEHPTTALLVVEVAQASLRRDRAIKGAIYARFGIPEYWIVNLEAECVEVHCEPRNEGYAVTRVVPRGERLTCNALPGLSLAVSDLLGP